MTSPLEQSVAECARHLRMLPLCMRILWLASATAAVLEDIPEADRPRAASVLASAILGSYADDGIGVPEGTG